MESNTKASIKIPSKVDDHGKGLKDNDLSVARELQQKSRIQENITVSRYASLNLLTFKILTSSFINFLKVMKDNSTCLVMSFRPCSPN